MLEITMICIRGLWSKLKRILHTNEASTYPELKFFKGNALDEIWLWLQALTGICILCTDFKRRKI